MDSGRVDLIGRQANVDLAGRDEIAHDRRGPHLERHAHVSMSFHEPGHRLGHEVFVTEELQRVPER